MHRSLVMCLVISIAVVKTTATGSSCYACQTPGIDCPRCSGLETRCGVYGDRCGAHVTGQQCFCLPPSDGGLLPTGVTCRPQCRPLSLNECLSSCSDWCAHHSTGLCQPTFLGWCCTRLSCSGGADRCVRASYRQ
ncbi:uncharacterized protein LOC122375333 [Amphibalanus amphitrite]|uniref:uncharacterized protein LOC122375333 n=1 Tax=Amphibalanus amphitrite TaxID=1232801 RepID=UPI001C925B75|nr:uncharacterized protein LOC122375333 [Amphibalanus amphitrite]